MTSVVDRPPMLPLIAREAKFVFSTDVEAAQYSSNIALVAQLTDSLRCWLSHIADVMQEYQAFVDWCDREEVMNLVELAQRTHLQEVSVSFCHHVEKDAIVSCIRVLKHVKSGEVPGLLERLDREVGMLRQLHEVAANAMQYAEAAAVFMKPFAWEPENGMDTAPPLFSALRAMWVCCPFFGSKNPKRFSAIVRFIIQNAEHCIHIGCGTTLQQFMDAPFKSTQIKGTLVGAQDTIVTLQEQYHSLRDKLASASGASTEADHMIFVDHDDDELFRRLNWQYYRVTGVLQLIDILKKDMNKVGSSLTDPLVGVDVLDPDVLDEGKFAKILHQIENSDAPDPGAVLERIGNKRSPQKKSYAPRMNFSQLTSNLIVHVEFNPPTLTIVGGPMSEAFLDSAQSALPLCCSNTVVRRVTRKALEPTFKEIEPNVRRMVIEEQYCETDTTMTHFFATLLDLLETEDAWSMNGSMAGVAPAVEEGGEEKQWYTFNFRRQRPREESPRRVQPAHAGLLLLEQPPYRPDV